MIYNLTPHTVTVFFQNNVIRSYPKNGPPARVGELYEQAGEVDGVEAVRINTGETEVFDLPRHKSPDDGTRYIVSRLVFDAIPWRRDLIVPDTSPDSCVRNDSGQIVGVRRFIVR